MAHDSDAQRLASDPPDPEPSAPNELSPEDQALMVRVPLTTVGWLGLPVFLLGLTGLFVYAGFAMRPGGASPLESGVVILAAALSGGVAVAIAVFAHRAYTWFTPEAARPYFRALRWWSVASALMGIVLAVVTQHFGPLVLTVLAGIVHVVGRRRTPQLDS